MAQKLKTQMTMESLSAIAIDMGGTHLRGALVNCQGEILFQHKEKTNAENDARGIISQICELVESVREKASQKQIIGVGLSVPGPIDTKNGIILGSYNIPGMRNLAIRDLLQSRLCLPVVLENDGIAAAIGEWQYGAAIGCTDYVYVSIGTGIGGGGIVNGKPLRGRDGFAGHFGHMVIIADGEKCSCGNLGCWEAYGCGPALLRSLAANGYKDFESFLKQTSKNADSTETVLNSYGDVIGLGIVCLLHIFNPEKIIIGGGVSQVFDNLLVPITQRIEKSAMKPFQGVPIQKSALDDNTGLLGAAYVLFEKISGRTTR